MEWPTSGTTTNSLLGMCRASIRVIAGGCHKSASPAISSVATCIFEAGEGDFVGRLLAHGIACNGIVLERKPLPGALRIRHAVGRAEFAEIGRHFVKAFRPQTLARRDIVGIGHAAETACEHHAKQAWV